MDISPHISHLLFDHECVIVPGLGGFVSNYAPARIHPVQHFFQPPSKTILFNPELKNNDGLLANFIAETESISFSDALSNIKEFTRNTRSEIKTGKRVELEKIGTLYTGNEGSLLFDQDEKTNYLKASYGFGSFISPMISRKYRKVSKKPEIKFTNRRESEYPKTRKQTVVWALVLIPLFIIFGWVSMKTQLWNGMSRSETSLVPTLSEQITDAGETENTASVFKNSKSEPGPAEENSIAVITEKATFIPELIDPETATEEASITEPKTEPKAEIVTPTPTPVIQQKMYHLIGGSFENIENAENLILSYEQEGYSEPRVIGQASNGYYRVSISAYLKKSDAVSELKKIRETLNPQAWILKQ